MSTYNSIEPITDEELNDLEKFLALDEMPCNNMSIDMLDGFLTAILIGPSVIMPSTWLPYVWDVTGNGEEPTFTTLQEAQKIISLILKLYQRNAMMLNDNKYEPLANSIEFDDQDFDELEVINTLQTVWSDGFMIGIHFDMDNWATFLNNNEISDPLMTPIAALSSPMNENMNISKQMLDKCWNAIPICVAEIKKFWMTHAPQKQGIVDDTFTMNAPRKKNNIAQRNAPCPCGSGKKYKHCCGK